jgi:hypothetical protein
MSLRICIAPAAQEKVAGNIGSKPAQELRAPEQRAERARQAVCPGDRGSQDREAEPHEVHGDDQDTHRQGKAKACFDSAERSERLDDGEQQQRTKAKYQKRMLLEPRTHLWDYGTVTLLARASDVTTSQFSLTKRCSSLSRMRS